MVTDPEAESDSYQPIHGKVIKRKYIADIECIGTTLSARLRKLGLVKTSDLRRVNPLWLMETARIGVEITDKLYQNAGIRYKKAFLQKTYNSTENKQKLKNITGVKRKKIIQRRIPKRKLLLKPIVKRIKTDFMEDRMLNQLSKKYRIYFKKLPPDEQTYFLSCLEMGGSYDFVAKDAKKHIEQRKKLVDIHTIERKGIKPTGLSQFKSELAQKKQEEKSVIEEAKKFFRETKKLTPKEKIIDLNRFDPIVLEPERDVLPEWKRELKNIDISGVDTPDIGIKTREAKFTAYDKTNAKRWINTHPTIKRKAVETNKLFELTSKVAKEIANSRDPEMIDWYSYLTYDSSIQIN